MNADTYDSKIETEARKLAAVTTIEELQRACNDHEFDRQLFERYGNAGGDTGAHRRIMGVNPRNRRRDTENAVNDRQGPRRLIRANTY